MDDPRRRNPNLVVCAVICGLVVKVDDAKVKLVFANRREGQRSKRSFIVIAGTKEVLVVWAGICRHGV